MSIPQPPPTPQDLFHHIRMHLHSNLEGIREHLTGIPDADVADLLNRFTLAEAAEVIALLTLPRAVKVCNQPTLLRRSALFEQLDVKLAAHILEGLASDQRVAVVRDMSPRERQRLLP